MSDINYLTIEQIILMNSYLIKTITPDELIGIREPTALHMTVESPKQEIFGQEVYPSLVDKASILFINLIKKHCFHNGNKRTAYMALHAFLQLNGFKLSMPSEEATDWCVEIAKWPNGDFESLKDFVVHLIEEKISK